MKTHFAVAISFMLGMITGMFIISSSSNEKQNIIDSQKERIDSLEESLEVCRQLSEQRKVMLYEYWGIWPTMYDKNGNEISSYHPELEDSKRKIAAEKGIMASENPMMISESYGKSIRDGLMYVINVDEDGYVICSRKSP